MKLTCKVQPLVMDALEEIVVADIDIAGVKYAVRITNRRGRMCISFSRKGVDEFEIYIKPIDGKDGRASVTFGRLESRPGHDHSDWQKLMIWRPNMTDEQMHEINYTWGRRCEGEPFWEVICAYGGAKDSGVFSVFELLFGKITHGEDGAGPFELDWKFV